MRTTDMNLTRLLEAVAGGRRPTTVAMFRQARRYRDEGRFEEAAELVARGLELDPQNVVGHLLAGSLHTVFRDMDRAKAAFERVLTLDRTHPRALLGLARIALEEDDRPRCLELLRKALERYPDFPEAEALLAVVNNTTPLPRVRRAPITIRPDRLRMPAERHELLIARIDATLLLAHPRLARSEELAGRTAQLCRLAAALAERARLGELDYGVIESPAETTYLRADGDIVLALTFDRDVEMPAALAHLDRIWVNCRAELASQVA